MKRNKFKLNKFKNQGKDLFLKGYYCIVCIFVFQSCIRNTNEVVIDNIINEFEEQFPIAIKESLPLNSYELGFFTNQKDTFVYIQRNELMFYSEVSKFLTGKEISNYESQDELYYYGSFFTTKKNVVNVYDMSSRFGNKFLTDKTLKKENLFQFSYKNLDQDATIEIYEPKYHIYKIKGSELITIKSNFP